jgi:hypothetical protein
MRLEPRPSGTQPPNAGYVAKAQGWMTLGQPITFTQATPAQTLCSSQPTAPATLVEGIAHDPPPAVSGGGSNLGARRRR